MERLAAAGHPPVLLCADRLRLAVRRFLEASLPNLAVLGYSEVSTSAAVVIKETIEEPVR